MKLQTRFAFSVLWLLWGLPISAGAATWYVDNLDGQDDHSGTEPQKAFRSLARAIRSAGTSDSLVLRNTGRAYREPLKLVRLGGTPSKPFTIEGNGAVLSGLRPVPRDAWTLRPEGTWEIRGPRPYGFPTLHVDGKPAPEGNPDQLAPGEWAWPRVAPDSNEGVLRYRPPEGSTPDTLLIEATLESSGLQVSSSSYITVRNLICEYHSNDGFNIHGDCRGIVCASIEGRYNGDDGFSIHESIEAVVRDGWFHHNGSGIEDVNLSRSFYSGIRVHDNRKLGVLFIGAFHSAVDAVVADNPSNFIIRSSETRHLVGGERSPIRETSVYLQNVISIGGEVGITMSGQARLMASHVLIRGARTGIESSSSARLHLTCSAVVECGLREMTLLGQEYYGDYNVFHPGRFRIRSGDVLPEGWSGRRTEMGEQGHSLLLDPEMTSDHRIGAPAAARIGKHVVGPTDYYPELFQGRE